MTPTCTWQDPPEVNCELPAAHAQRAQDGEVWANLCEAHHKEIEAAMESMNPAKILRSWVRAMGGPKVATKRMMKK